MHAKEKMAEDLLINFKKCIPKKFLLRCFEMQSKSSDNKADQVRELLIFQKH